MTPFDDLFHVGIRVRDIEAAERELSDLFGVTWCSRQDRQMALWLPGQGAVTLPVLINYTAEGPVHLELLQGPAGSIWDGNDLPGAHHFGVWVDDVRAETERRMAQGWTLELAADTPENGYGRFTYLRSPQGVIVEPVAAANRPRFERWWAGGSLT